MLGIGIGAFGQGAMQGYGLGEKIQKGMEERDKKRALSEALKTGQADYDSAVSSGEAQQNDPNGLLRYAYPRIFKAYQESGDLEGLKAASEWITSDQAKQGTQLFGSGLLKLQTGDVKGAIDDLTKLGKLKGYGNGFSIDDSEELPGGRVRIKGASSTGEAFDREFTRDELAGLISTHLNPEAGFTQIRENWSNQHWRQNVTGVADRIVQAESGGDPTAKNPRSSATGAGQFVNATWLDLVKRHKPELMEGKTPRQVLSLRNDPDLSRQMTEVYARENAQKLSARGLPETPATTYLAHFLGADGAISVLRAAPNTPISRLLPAKVINANPTVLRGRTAGQVIGWAGRKIGDAGESKVAEAPSQTMSDAAPTSSEAASTATAAGQQGEPFPEFPAFLDRRAHRPPVEGATAGGLAERFGLSPEQTDMLASLGPEEGKKQLAKVVFEQKPTLAREFDHARSQGFEGDQFDFITAKQQAAAGTVERVRAKIAKGERLTAGEQKVYDDAIRLSQFDKILLGQGLLGQGQVNAGMPQTADVSAPAAEGNAGSIPQPAAEMLRSDPSPEARREFDEMFGQGAADQVLGGR